MLLTTDLDGDLLAREEARRREQFVGRRRELSALCGALDEPGARVFYIHGPAGIGKTSLVQMFDAEARSRGLRTIRLDARDLGATSQNIGAALAACDPQIPSGTRAVVFLDTYELLRAIDPQVLRELLRHVRHDTVVVIAGRVAPSAEWRSLSLWGRSVAPLPLRNLTADEATGYLERRGVDPTVAAAISAFAHGHPLALAIAAEAWLAAPGPQFAPTHALDVVTALYDFFMRGIPEVQRAVLEVAAVLPMTAETTLAMLLDRPPGGLFAWLRGLSFIIPGLRGLFPHDLTREVILAELRWRNPARLATLSTRAQRYFANVVQAADPTHFSRAFADFTFVLSHNPRARALMVLPDEDLFLGDLRPGDPPTLCAAVAHHEGVDEAAIAAHWLACQPEAFRIAHDSRGVIRAFVAFVRLDLATAGQLAADPLAAAAWMHAQRESPGGVPGPVAYGRYFMSIDRHQQPCPAMAVCSQGVGPLVFLPGFAMLFVRMSEWGLWGDSARLCGAEILPELGHARAGKSFVVTLQDHRGLSGVEWMARFSERTAVEDWGLGAPTSPVDSSLSALSHEEFETRVREALRALNEPITLARNPLVHCQAVQERVPTQASFEERVASLQSLLGEQIAALRGSPRGDAWYRVLFAAYLEPQGKHETIARDLGLSYSTFRRQLGAATEHLVERLWLRETG